MRFKIFWRNIYQDGPGILSALENEVNTFLSYIHRLQIEKIEHVTHNNLEIIYLWYRSNDENT